MAKFNPSSGQGEVVPNFTGDSKGIRSDDARADTSFANLFEGLGEGVLLGVNAIDQSIQANIQSDIEVGLDQLDADFGVDSAANLGEVMEAEVANLPANISDSFVHLQGLQQAREDGTLPESHYWARAQSLVRQLRGKYPGYREIIDDKIASITGVRPANALRRSLMQEWGEGASDDQKELFRQIKVMSADGSLTDIYDDWDERVATGNIPTLMELISEHSKWNETEATIRRGRAHNAALEEKGQLDQATAARTFRQEITKRRESIMDKAVLKTEKTMGAPLLEITRKLKKDRAAGKAWTPEEAQQLAAIIEDTRLQMDAAFDSILRSYVMDGIAPDPKDVEAARQEFMKPVESLMSALTEKDTGGLHAWALQREAKKEEMWSDLVKENEALGLIEVMKDKIGSESLSIVLANEPDFQSAFVELHRRVMLNNALIGDPNDPERSKSIRQDLETIAKDKKISDSDANLITKSTMEGFVKTIEMIGSDQELPPELLANYVEYMFGEEAFGATQHLSMDARRKFFTTVSSPRVTKKMMELRDNGRPELWETYQKWVANEFKSQFKGDVAQIQDYVLNPDVFDVHYDPQRMAFEFVMNPELSPSEKLKIEHTGQVRILEQTRRSINNAIQTLAPVVEANDMNPAEQVMHLLTKEMGYNPDAPPNEKTVIDGMLDALGQMGAIAAEDVRHGDLPLLGKRASQRLNQTFWDLTAPFSPQFRSSEERRGTEKDEPSNPALDQRLNELKSEYPEAVKTLQSRATPPKFDELGWMHRWKIQEEADKLGVTPQQVIDRAHALANPKKPQAKKVLAEKFLLEGKDSSHVEGMDDDFAARLNNALHDPDMPKGVTIYSGYRSPEHQARLFNAAVKKYGSVAKARRYVAPPGNSRHNHGGAADLMYNGVRLDKIDPATRERIHRVMSRHGMHFRMDWEPWHVEVNPEAKPLDRMSFEEKLEKLETMYG